LAVDFRGVTLLLGSGRVQFFVTTSLLHQSKGREREGVWITQILMTLSMRVVFAWSNSLRPCKNFPTSKNELFRNSRKLKVRKFPSNAGPYNSFSQQSIFEMDWIVSKESGNPSKAVPNLMPSPRKSLRPNTFQQQFPSTRTRKMESGNKIWLKSR